MRGASIRGAFDCAGGRFVNPGGIALNLEDVKLGGNIGFIKRFACFGKLCLKRADINGNLIVSDAILRARETCIDLRYSRISGELSWELRRWRGIADFEVAQALVLRDIPPAPGSKLRLNGFVYEHIASESYIDSQLRLRWLAQSEFAPKAYRHLANLLHSAGHDTEAIAVSVALLPKRREKLPRRAVARRVWDWLQDVVLQYGYRPERLLAIGSAWFLLVGTYYTVAAAKGAFIPAQDDLSRALPSPALRRSNPVADLAPFDRALEECLPFLDFEQHKQWRVHTAIPLGRAVQEVSRFNVVFGWLLATVAVTSFGRLLKRD